MCNFCSICSVVHEEEVDLFGVVNQESLVAGGNHMASLLVGAETNLSEKPSATRSNPSLYFSSLSILELPSFTLL